MILVDLNQVVISNLMQQIQYGKKKLDEDLIRHMVLNSLRANIKKFKGKYGDIVICCDSKRYWRRDVFPFYKANRKKTRDASNLDWGLIFDTMDKVRAELKEHFPYKVIEVDGAEADDIIAVLAARYSPHEEILILSGDKDFMQLQKYKNVQQYSPILKKYISTDDPKGYIREHILRGDAGDGIPNFMSDDNTFVIGKRQKLLRKEKVDKWIQMSEAELFEDHTMVRGYKRNQMLIDLDYIPGDLQEQIANEYESITTPPRSGLLNYFIKNRLKNLIEVLDDF